MKKSHFPYAIAILLLTAGCNSGYREDVVCETYVHRYGVELPPEEWSERGQHGQVVSTLKDGVTVSRTYDSGVLHGETTHTFPHRDTIQKREIYDQGILTQEFLCHSNGLPYKQTIHTAPARQSTIVWYDSGAPQCKEEYENGMLVQGEYFTLNNSQETFVTNQNGTRICRDPYGELEHVDEIKNGQIQVRTTYHPNGTPSAITPYINGQPEGQKRLFLPDGQPKAIETWVKGQQHGATTLFENGEKCGELPYVYGKIHGTEYRYRDDGKVIVSETSWMQGRKHGPSYAYVGDVKKTDWYYKGRLVNKQTYDALRSQE